MDFREVIVWLGLLAILAILWDGFRRMRANPKPKKSSEDKWVDPEEAKKKAEIARELPNGGARVREMTHDEKKKLNSKLKLNLRERVPMLMERVVVEGEETDAERLEKESDSRAEQAEGGTGTFQSEIDFTPAVENSSSEEAASEKTSKVHIEPTIGAFDDDLSEDASSEEVSVEETHTDAVVSEQLIVDEHVEDELENEVDSNNESIDVNLDENIQAIADENDDEVTADDLAVDSGRDDSEPPLPVEDLVVVHLMAKAGSEINGRALLELLIRAGLRHGPMNIFHYRNPAGKTEFSLANCVQPGTFNPDVMADVNTPGVTLFLQLPCTADAMESFEHMIEMARFMAANLDTDVLDEDHNTVTPQVIEYYREKLRAFARKKLIPS